MEEKVSTEELDALFGDDPEEGEAAANPEAAEEGDVAEEAEVVAPVADADGAATTEHYYGTFVMDA